MQRLPLNYAAPSRNGKLALLLPRARACSCLAQRNPGVRGAGCWLAAKWKQIPASTREISESGVVGRNRISEAYINEKREISCMAMAGSCSMQTERREENEDIWTLYHIWRSWQYVIYIYGREEKREREMKWRREEREEENNENIWRRENEIWKYINNIYIYNICKMSMKENERRRSKDIKYIHISTKYMKL